MGYKALIILNIVLLAVIARLVFKPLSPAPGIRVWEGETWTAAQYGSRYILSIKNHSELASAITSFVKARGITSGSIYGIGAVNSATLRFFDPSTKKYIDKTFDGQMEIANLTGNIAMKDGGDLIHLHVTLGIRDYQALAGHLLAASLSGAGEFVVETMPGIELEKNFDKNIGLNLYNFKK